MHEELPTPSLGVEWLDDEHRLIVRRVQRPIPGATPVPASLTPAAGAKPPRE